MDVQQKLDEIIAVVEKAKAMPMSSSCVVNRAELTGLLRDLREAMPAELAQAQSVVADHQQMVADAQAQADHIIRGAHDERGSLISDTEVVRQAQAEADRVLAEARTEVQTKRAEADDYVDSKLANFEVVLTKTLGAVGRGRQKLRGDSGVYEPEQDGAEDGEEFRPRISPSPEADEYVDVKLATLEAVLSATLEAVGKGRDKRLGKAPIDELGAYLAAADEAQQLKDRAEAVAAGFADGAAPEDPQNWYADVPQQQSWPEQTPAAAGWQQPGEDPYGRPQPAEDPYGQPQAPQYAEVYGGGYDPAAAPQTDPYGQPYGQQQPVDPYYQQQPQDQQPQGFDQWGNPLPVDPYGYQQQPQQQAQLPQQQAGLDETSFFDTSMIDMTRLRELGGR
ncbi:MAG: cell division initiation protein [Kitasatospora sp.]|nr:cell division initiation protein [Kitasatospora sp.]